MIAAVQRCGTMVFAAQALIAMQCARASNEAAKRTAIASVSRASFCKNATTLGVWAVLARKSSIRAALTALLRSLNSRPSSRACAGDTAGCSHITLAAAIRRTRIRPLMSSLKQKLKQKKRKRPPKPTTTDEDDDDDA